MVQSIFKKNAPHDFSMHFCFNGGIAHEQGYTKLRFQCKKGSISCVYYSGSWMYNEKRCDMKLLVRKLRHALSLQVIEKLASYRQQKKSHAPNILYSTPLPLSMLQLNVEEMHTISQ